MWIANILRRRSISSTTIIKKGKYNGGLINCCCHERHTIMVINALNINIIGWQKIPFMKDHPGSFIIADVH